MTDDIYVDLRAAGLPTPSSTQGREDLAKQLGFSYKHLDNVMSARKPYGGRLKTTIRGWLSDEYLSAAKSEQTQPAPLSPLNKDEPVVESKYVLEHGEIRERDPVFAPVIEREVSNPPHDLGLGGKGKWFINRNEKYGGFEVVMVAAVCATHDMALTICDMLNKEAG